MASKVLLLELNEVNFGSVQHYCDQGLLPVLARIIHEHGVFETASENRYEDLEPWIQWITAHTGLTLGEHGVFRLGDIVERDIHQIWEALEQEGLTVGAVSPMNAKNRCRNAAFFVPDPWTPAELTARPLLKHLYNAVAQVVNDNAQSKITGRSAAWLLAGATKYARLANYGFYLKMAKDVRHKPWSKAMFLDLLLTDIFIHETKKTRPDFASLFLNAGAHIQHHYMFNSAAYTGALKNPDWYAAPDIDPVLEVYQLYDRIVGQIQEAFPDRRLMIATGLHQDPHPEVTFYWRLKNHADFLRKLDVPFVRVEPRMSRDFVIFCNTAEDAAQAERILASAMDQNDVPLFEVDNRGSDLFVMLTYPHDVSDDLTYRIGNKSFAGFKNDIAFVAIKNGQHNGIGYFIDTGAAPGSLPEQFPLAEIPSRICEALSVPWTPRAAAAE